MLQVNGRRTRHCDGVSRRAVMQIGAAGICGVSLPALLRAEASQGIHASQKAIINVHLDGGAPQMDTIDPKPDGPTEVRGEFGSTATTIAGLRISELMPKLARDAERFAFIRSLVRSIGRHHAYQTQSGFDEKNLVAIGGRPAMGCVVNRLAGSTSDRAPAYVDIMQGRGLVRNSARPGFLGPAFGPFRPDMSKLFRRELEPGMQGELQRLGNEHAVSLELLPEMSPLRLNDRQSLLGQLDTMRRQFDVSGSMDALDRFNQQAVGILMSGDFASAFDLESESAATLALYSPDIDYVRVQSTSEGPEAAKKLLLARRLVEAGVRVVSVSISDFDTHRNNFPRMKQLLPIVDTAITGLVEDLHRRGMLDDVSVVVWGEFGRTPKINANGGRDHWPKVSPAILAGGGMSVGQVIGSTDRWAGEATSRPVSFQDVIATLYRNLGIDPHITTVDDTRGRPQYLVDSGEAIPELV